MQDFTGIPCVVDLATTHEAVTGHTDARPSRSLRPLPQRTTSHPNTVQRHDWLGGLLHEYQQVA
jgi:aconitase A